MQGGSDSSSDYETGREKMPLAGKIFIAVCLFTILGLIGFGYVYC